jgi:protein subunit release factor B|tara:strand:+ start:102 stop:506 length:405 start_codon:yes stop_codon:yes gene_type:complete
MKWKEDSDLERRMNTLGIDEADMIERFVKGNGPGGQKINKTASCVYLKHVPSGMEVKCQEERSLVLNRHCARIRLCEAFEGVLHKRQQAAQKTSAKLRFQKRKRSSRQKAKIVSNKRQHGRKKSLRRRPTADDG